MCEKGSLIRKLLLPVLLFAALMLAGTALAEGEIGCVDFVLYEDGTVLSESYSFNESNGYVLKDFMALNPWSFKLNPESGNCDMSRSEIVNAWEAGMREWNSHLERPMFSMDNALTTQKGRHVGDGNIISFDELEKDVLARTSTWLYKDAEHELPAGYPARYSAVEVDIVFNSKSSVHWTDVSKGGVGHDLQSLITHELGHTLGLGDVYDERYDYVTMYGFGTKDEISARSIEKPDLIGLSKFYNVPGYGGPGTLPPLPTPTPTAQPTDTPVYRARSVCGLNMRSAPDMSGNVVKVLLGGTELLVTERGEVWSKVICEGMEGYVMTQFLAFEGSATPVPTPAASATPQPTDVHTTPTPQVTSTPAPTATASATPAVTATPKPQDIYAVVTATRLNMRSAPDTGANNVIRQISNGQRIRVIRYADEWSEVEYLGKRGFVASQYIRLESGDAKPTYTPTAKPTTVPSIAEDAVVNVSRLLNMRSTPSTSGTLIAQIPAGTIVKVIDYGSEWSRIIYGNKKGYVASRYIDMLESGDAVPTVKPTSAPKPDSTPKPETPVQGAEKTVALGGAGRLNVRSGAGYEYPSVGMLKNGEVVRVISESNGWSRIEKSGLDGYALSQYLK